MNERKYRVRVYLKYGQIYEYDVHSVDAAIRHARAIANDGYQRQVGEWIEFYGPDKVMKTKAEAPGIEQEYRDRVAIP